jgi:hypothetical protein
MKGISMKTITKAVATKLLKTIDAGLCEGVGTPEPGKMCIEAAVCFALGRPHGDKPECVANVVREHKIIINDSQWSSDAARAKGLRRAGLAQLGSKGVVDEAKFLRIVIEKTIRHIVPIALFSAASVHPDKEHRDAMRNAAKRCQTEGTDAAAAAADDAAYAAAYAADAADAAYAYADAADAAYAAYAAAAYAAAYAAAAAADDAWKQLRKETIDRSIASFESAIALTES